MRLPAYGAGRESSPALQAGIDQILGQRADDAVAAGIDLGYFAGCLRAVSITPQAEALMTADTPPDCA